MLYREPGMATAMATDTQLGISYPTQTFEVTPIHALHHCFSSDVWERGVCMHTSAHTHTCIDRYPPYTSIPWAQIHH